MQRIDYPEPLQRLVFQLKRLPGIGPRSAERIALWLVGSAHATPGRNGQTAGARGRDLATAITETAEAVHPCPQCGFFTTAPLCAICEDDSRAGGPLCVVEQPTDILPLERTGVFRGRYHALGGRLAPLDHVSPEDLNIDGLLDRVRAGHAAEVILALGADVEGEATAQYLAGLLREFPHVRVTRIAQGLPAGGGLEAADELTLSRALTGRVRLT
ncbi:MAG: recombination protein RecR [Verrucomicrobia bacterium]|nr:recombination protein RecR [Verrucomicrobiota bacterium]